MRLWGKVELNDDDEQYMFQFFRYKMAEEMRNDVMETIHVCCNFNLIIVYLLPVNKRIVLIWPGEPLTRYAGRGSGQTCMLHSFCSQQLGWVS